MIERCKEIFESYNIETKDVKELPGNKYAITLNDDKKVIVKNIDDKEKIAWEYKTLFNLQNKMRIPKVFKVGDEYIKEATVLEEIEGMSVRTYEEKEAAASLLGNAIGMLHIVEINEQSSEEELKKIWEKHILSKTLYFGTKIIELFNKDVNEKIFNYLNENMHYVKEDYEATMILGKITNDDYVLSNSRVILTNFENAMIGDPTYDFALFYDYYYDNAEQIDKFISGYEDYMGVPENFENKLPFYKLIVLLDKIVELSNDRDKNKEEIEKALDMINSIIDGKFIVRTYKEEA